jgi:hypothetical protein
MKTQEFIIKHNGKLRMMSTLSHRSVRQVMDEFTIEVLKYLLSKQMIVSASNKNHALEARYLLSKYKSDADDEHKSNH